jgi:hypothetical protein
MSGEHGSSDTVYTLSSNPSTSPPPKKCYFGI